MGAVEEQLKGLLQDHGTESSELDTQSDAL
jgi:hypothetical protein